MVRFASTGEESFSALLKGSFFESSDPYSLFPAIAFRMPDYRSQGNVVPLVRRMRGHWPPLLSAPTRQTVADKLLTKENASDSGNKVPIEIQLENVARTASVKGCLDDFGVSMHTQE